MKYLKWIRSIGCKVNYFVIVKQNMPHKDVLHKANYAENTSMKHIHELMSENNLTSPWFYDIIRFTM